jgi:ankyrin repeat protein
MKQFARRKDGAESNFNDEKRLEQLLIGKLFYCVEAGDYKALNELFETYSSTFGESTLANARDEDDDTPLIVACLLNHLLCIDVLVARGALIDVVGCSTRSPMHCAAFQGHRQTVERLIELNATLIGLDSLQDLPIHKAAMNDHSMVIETL